MTTQGENYLIIEDHIIPQGVVLAILAPFVLILNFPPLIWHLRNRNTAAISMVFWVMLMNFLSVLNVIIWPYIDMRNMYDGQGLCDVEIKLLGARTAGLNAAILCLLRSLAAVLNVDKNLLGPSKAQKRWNRVIELAWCVGLPLLTMILQYIVQINRFALLGVSGCQPVSLMGWTGFVLIYLPPIVANTIALCYAGKMTRPSFCPQTASNHVPLLTVLVIIRLHKYWSSFNTILASSNTTRSRFFRLFATASTLILGITPLQIWIIATHYPRQNYPFNFRELHDSKTWNTSVVLPSTVLYDRWINLACGFLIFFFFGMGKDAKGMYREWLVKVGLGRLSPVLLVESHGSSNRGGLSSNNSKKSLWRKSSWIASTARYVSHAGNNLLNRELTRKVVLELRAQEPRLRLQPLPTSTTQTLLHILHSL